MDKADLRALHGEAVRRQLERARARLERFEGRLLRRIAAGTDVVPDRI
jgi:hypothetical protein